MKPLEQYDAITKVVTDERGKIYGHPAEDFSHVTALVGALPECYDPRFKHIMYMICVKMCRAARTPTHIDSWADIAGYARTAAMIIDRVYPNGEPDRASD